MGPTWGPPGSCRPQLGSMLAPWTLLLGLGENASNSVVGIVPVDVLTPLCVRAFEGRVMIKYSYQLFISVTMPLISLNTPWPSDSKWWHISGSTLALLMSWCRQATEPILTYHQCSSLVLTKDKFRKKCSKYKFIKCTFVKLLPYLPGANELKHCLGTFKARYGP